MRRQVVRLAIALGSCAFIFATGCAKKEVVKSDEAMQQQQQQPSQQAQGQAQPTTPQEQQKPPVKEDQVIAQQVTETPQVIREEPAKTDQAVAPETVLQTIYFDFDSFVLGAPAREVLTKNAEYLKKNAGIRVQLEGHTDERGSDDYNLSLGEKRAKAAQSYLTTLGIQGDRVSIISYGEEKPADSGHTDAAWARNRRVEFVIVR